MVLDCRIPRVKIDICKNRHLEYMVEGEFGDEDQARHRVPGSTVKGSSALRDRGRICAQISSATP